MTDRTAIEQARTRFVPFGLDGERPAWSSHVLEKAFDESSAEAAFRVVHEILGARDDLPRPLAQFIRELVKVSVRLRGPDLGGADVSWMAEVEPLTPAQAFFTSWLLPEAHLTGEVVLRILRALEETEYFSEVVVELQDVLTSSAVAPVVATRAPDVAAKVRAALLG